MSTTHLLCAGLLTLTAWLYTRGRRDRRAMRAVLDQQGDDICWMDIYATLGRRLGREWKPNMLPRAEFEANCRRYAEHVYTGCPYRPGV